MIFDWEEFERWMKQAKHTLNSIEADIENKSYDWACFKAHQAAEYALKAILRGLGKTAFGHDLKRLLGELIPLENADRRVYDCVMYLNKMYIPPRYPDAFSSGSPFEFYTRDEAIAAKDCSLKVISWVEDVVREIEEGD